MPVFERLKLDDDYTARYSVLKFRDTILNDYRRTGLSEDQIKNLDPRHGDANIGPLMQAMQNSPREYYAVESGEPVEMMRVHGREYVDPKFGNAFAAVAALGDWLYGDEAPYHSLPYNYINRARHRRNHRLGRPVTDKSANFPPSPIWRSGR